jgi:hypothetical protein
VSAGYYASSIGSISCIACTIGVLSDNEGAVSCTKCTPGYYAATCKRCSTGKLSASDRSYCTDCKSGEYSFEDASCEKVSFSLK